MPQPCPQCQSTKYYRHNNGTLFCEFGHQNLDYIETLGDDVKYIRVHTVRNQVNRGPNIQANDQKKLPRPKTNQQRNQSSSNLNDTHRTYILAQILQATLNDQAQALCVLFDLPPIFPDVCRDLWLLYLQSLNFDFTVTKPPALDHPVNSIHSVDSKSSRIGASLDTITSTMDGIDDDGIIEFDFEDALDTSDDDIDSVNPSDYVTYPFQMSPSTQVHKVIRPGFSFHYLPSFLYLACLHLSIPLCVADIHRLCVCGKLPYGKNLRSLLKYKLDFPSNIILDKFAQLRGNKVIPTATMRKYVTIISNQLTSTYKLMTLPPNHVPLFIRWANEWGLGLRFAYTGSHLMDVFKQTHPQCVFIDELIIGCVALKCAQLLTLANLIPKRRRYPVYPFTPINPPVTKTTMEPWASDKPNQFVNYVLGTRFVQSEPMNSYKDMYQTLNDLLVDQQVTATTQEDVFPDGTTFPLGFQDCLHTVLDNSDKQWDEYLWHCVLSAMRCSRAELSVVYQYVSTELQDALPR